MSDITANTLKALIAQKYEVHRNGPHRYVVFFELRDGTSIHAAQSMDAFAMNIWPSGGFDRYAFEIKVHRSDFLKELDNPNKRKWAMDVSNEFWFVCAPDVAKPEEIPETCGLMVANGKNLRKLVRAKHREAGPFEIWEIAALLRAAHRKQDFPSLLRWMYAGQEITGDMLDKIAREQMTYVEEAAIEEKAKAKAKEFDDFRNDTMRMYAEEMRVAGIVPPDFMVGKYGDPWRHSVKQWVEKHLVSGPEASKVRSAAGSIRMAEKAIESAKADVISLAPEEVQL